MPSGSKNFRELVIAVVAGAKCVLTELLPAFRKILVQGRSDMLRHLRNCQSARQFENKTIVACDVVHSSCKGDRGYS